MAVQRWMGGWLLAAAVGLLAGCGGDGWPPRGAMDGTGGQAGGGMVEDGSAMNGGGGPTGGSTEADAPGFKLELEAADSLSQDAAGNGPGPGLGQAAPELALKGLDGRTYRLQDWRGEKPVVVNFWASWCPPCELEAPDLVYLSEKYQDEVVFLGVNLTNRDTLADAKAFVERHGYRFPVLLDEKGIAGRDWQVVSIPTTYFIDRNGTVQYKLYGVTTRGRLEAMVQKLLVES